MSNDVLPLTPVASDDNPFGKPESCRTCTLFKEPGLVPLGGNRNAKALYVGEGPGADEVDWPSWYDRTKHGEPRPNLQVILRVRATGEEVKSSAGFRPERFAPFIGGAGRIRKALFQHAGISTDVHVATTNCVKCRPPGNRLPTDYEIACCAPFLIAEIEDVNPNVIIAAGDTALKTLTGKTKIGIWRGVVTEGPRRCAESPGSNSDQPIRSPEANGGSPVRYKIFPTWHPVFLMHQQYQWPFAVHDLARAKVESGFPEIRRVPFTIDRQADLGVTRDDLGRDIRARGACTLDFETTGLSARDSAIRMCGFVGRPEKAYVYDWTTGAQQLFAEILALPDVEICGQNILYFDFPFAEDKGFDIGDHWKVRTFDTMVAFHLANSSYGQTSISSQNAGNYAGARGTEKDLSFIASNHTDIEYWKSRDSYKNDIHGVCGVDVIATDRSAYHPVTGLKAELKSYDMLDLYYNHVLPVHLPLRRMTQRGVKIDEDRAARWSVLLEQNADRLEKTLKEGLGEPGLNLESPKQLMELLYGKLGLPVQYLMDKKKGRRPTANAEAIEALARIAPENKILMSIVNIRHLRKMKSTYVDDALAYGRLHPRFGVSKAANGRMNSQGPNAQNVPEQMRDIWIPDDPDHVLISADSSQIEWRVAMVLSGDPVGLELLAAGVDTHRAVYAESHSVPLSEVDDARRHLAKFIIYGLGYGRGAKSIAEGHGLALSAVEEFIAKFSKRFGIFWQYRNDLPKEVQQQYFLANPFKRRRWWYTREITEIYNFPASSTAADMMYEEVIRLENELPKGATLRLTVHDEVVVNCPKDIVRETMECIRTVMQAPWDLIVNASRDPATVKKFYPNGWFCPADVHVGSNWLMCKSKNPQVKAERDKLERSLGLC